MKICQYAVIYVTNGTIIFTSNEPELQEIQICIFIVQFANKEVMQKI